MTEKNLDMHWTYRCETCSVELAGAGLVACINADHDVQSSHPLVPEKKEEQQ